MRSRGGLLSLRPRDSAGWPFSRFFHEVLDFYEIQALHLAQMREDGQRHHGVRCEMQVLNLVKIQNFMEESGERRDQARHGEGQEVYRSLRVSRPRPRLSRPHDGTVRHDLARKAKVPVCRDAGGREL
uniref:Uncharacterized protein n=2 Tax=Oryza TaxID=4527 RepID=A0A1V1H8V8_9ORYZ|nr:hypothetical protein [Oryza glaberrima]BAX24794.1 hypothetical protein [Oryza barthii]